MQIVLIVLFAALLSPGLLQERGVYGPMTRPGATLAAAVAVTLLIPLIIALASWISLRRLHKPGGFVRATTLFGHVHTAMRVMLLAGFGLLMTQTGWIRLVHQWRLYGRNLQQIPLAGDLVLLLPILIATILCWLAMYRTDRALRMGGVSQPGEPTGQTVWSLGQYLDFQVRYQMLTVVVPMSLFILASDLVGIYRRDLVDLTQIIWTPEAILAVLAAMVFVLSPLMLRFIWRTKRLPASALRSRLEETCRRMGLRYRDILIWQSHGAMVNAAVMGLLPQIRYILLSDGLLEHLTQEQVEAVFGHEAGHVREHHIAYYMIFAIGSMMAVSLGADWLLVHARLSEDTVELMVAGMVAMIWFVAFGWISRRFERQADLHGVRCLDGALPQCLLPCWQHNITPEPHVGERMCTTAAHVFSSALESVAALNGVSKFARSWRHSSIASRQDFVRQAAFYPETLRGFERMVRHIKAGLLVITILLTLLAAWNYWPDLFPRYRRNRIQYVRQPARWVMRDQSGTADKVTAWQGDKVKRQDRDRQRFWR